MTNPACCMSHRPSPSVQSERTSYDEPRLLYVAPSFAGNGRLTDEHRTIHIGLDLFAVAGTPVFAPLPGVIHAFADNRHVQDYGPVIVLRHETDDGVEFFTLYGHLSRESLSRVRVGQSVDAGDQIDDEGNRQHAVGLDQRVPPTQTGGACDRDAWRRGREWRMDAASASANHLRPPRFEH